MPAFALSDGRNLGFSESGEGPPLLLIHGSPGEGRAWNRVAPLLTGRFRVLAPDLPGYGASDPLREADGGTAAMARAVGELAASLGQPVWLAGHSYGGNVALHVALQTASHDRIRGLALFEPVFFRALALNGGQAIRDEAFRFFAAYAARAAAGEKNAVAGMVDYWFGPQAFARLPIPVQAFLDACAPRNARDVVSSFNEILDRDELARFDKPFHVVHGTLGAPVAASIAKALGAVAPAARVIAMAGAGHGLLDTHPRDVAEVILDLTKGQA
ncbi:MAG: alpha/beta hydrolase [Rhizobiales bacterium]|nr:alpha/beta hydrolase [Hyphomicrobiales bacterium]